MLNLKDRRADTGIAEEIHQERTLEVRDTNVLCKTQVDELLHLLPSGLDGGSALDNLLLECVPSAGVALCRVNVFESDGCFVMSITAVCPMIKFYGERERGFLRKWM